MGPVPEDVLLETSLVFCCQYPSPQLGSLPFKRGVPQGPPPPPLGLLAETFPLATMGDGSRFYWKKAIALSLGLNPKGLIGKGGKVLDGVGWEKGARWPSTIGPELLFAPDEAFEPLLHPNLHSIYAIMWDLL